MQNLSELMRRLISSRVEFVLVGGFAAVAHGATLVTRNRDFVRAARSLGASVPHILWLHILPNVLGPVLVNYIRQFQIDHGVARAQAYSITMYIMCALLLVGFLCNFAMRPVNERYHDRASAPAKGEKP